MPRWRTFSRSVKHIWYFVLSGSYFHQVGIYVLQVDQNSLAESLGLQVYLYSPYTQSECLIQILQIMSPSISPLVVFVHPLKLFLIFSSAGLPPPFHHRLSQSQPFNLRSQEPNFTSPRAPTSSKSKEKAFHSFLDLMNTFLQLPNCSLGTRYLRWMEFLFSTYPTGEPSNSCNVENEMKWNDS